MIIRDFDELVSRLSEHLAQAEGVDLDALEVTGTVEAQEQRQLFIQRSRTACLFLRDLEQLRAFDKDDGGAAARILKVDWT